MARGVYRWAALGLLGILTVLFVLGAQRVVAANQFDYGCCITTTDCIPGDDATFRTNTDFTNACGAANGEVKSPSYCQTSGLCEIGCCCAGPSVPGSSEINKTESLLSMTKQACTAKNLPSLPYTFKSSVIGKTCVQLCSGTSTTTQTATSYTLKGTVRKAGAPAQATISMMTSGGISESVTTDASGHYEKSLPANKQYTVTVEPVDTTCKPQPTTVLLTRDTTRDFTLDCAPRTGCVDKAPIITDLAAEKGTDAASFDITYDSSCAAFDSFVVYACKNKDDCVPVFQTEETHVTVSGLAPKAQYWFWVRAYESPSGHADSQKVGPLATGDAECMQGASQESWCGDTATGSGIFSCDEKNKLITSPCSAGQTCTQGTQGPTCTAKIDCSKCNGLLGLFSKLPLQIPTGVSNYAPRCNVQSQCYLEQTFVPSYQECAGVTSCANYTSRSSCTADKCGVESCAWKTGTSAVAEFGTGVCTTTDPDKVASCRQCKSAFGTCSKELCESISANCYYDGAENSFFRDGKAQCIPKQDMACRFYDTASDCGTAKVDITYDGSRRTGTTNKRTPSADRFGFGVCDWIEAGTYCIKDADNRRDAANPEDDCIEAGLSDEALLKCLSDVTPPVTTLLLKDPANYGSSEVNTLPYRATDDVVPASAIRTYFCLNTTAAPCYPNATIGTLNVPDADADYMLYYYSLDAHFNSEEVKSARIMVRKDGVTRLQRIVIEENGG